MKNQEIGKHVIILEVMSSIIDEIGSENVVQFISDSAEILNQQEISCGKISSLIQECVAHGIQCLKRYILTVKCVNNSMDDEKLVGPGWQRVC